MDLNNNDLEIKVLEFDFLQSHSEIYMFGSFGQ